MVRPHPEAINVDPTAHRQSVSVTSIPPRAVTAPLYISVDEIADALSEQVEHRQLDAVRSGDFKTDDGGGVEGIGVVGEEGGPQRQTGRRRWRRSRECGRR